MSNQTAGINVDEQAAKAAQEASRRAAEQAKEFASDAVHAIKGLDQPRLFYLV